MHQESESRYRVIYQSCAIGYRRAAGMRSGDRWLRRAGVSGIVMQHNNHDMSLANAGMRSGPAPSFKRAAMGFAASITALCVAAFFLGSL